MSRKKPNPPPGPDLLTWRMGQKPPPPPPGLPRRGEGVLDTPEPRGRQGGPTSRELFNVTTDQVVNHLNRRRRSDPPIKRGPGRVERFIVGIGPNWVPLFVVVVLAIAWGVTLWGIWIEFNR